MKLLPRRVLLTLCTALAASPLCLLPPAASGADGDSLIPNGNFEASQDGTWPTGWGHLKGGTWEQENGNHFYRLTSTHPGQMCMIYQQFKLPPGSEALELSWRERVTGLKVGSKPWFDARVLIKFNDAENKELKGAPGPSAAGKDTNAAGKPARCSSWPPREPAP